MKVIDTDDGQEVAFEWTCPKCGLMQPDSVHKEFGPFLALTCGGCGLVFADDDLSLQDLEEWTTACYAAETL